MHDMEYTSFIFDIVIGFVCGLIGLLQLFDHKKEFISNTGLIGLICGVVGFVLTFVYVIFNGLVYTTVYVKMVLISLKEMEIMQLLKKMEIILNAFILTMKKILIQYMQKSVI